MIQHVYSIIRMIQLGRPSTIFPTISFEIKYFYQHLFNKLTDENCGFRIVSHLNNYDTFTSDLTDQISIDNGTPTDVLKQILWLFYERGNNHNIRRGVI